MSLAVQGVRLCLNAKRAGASFERVLSIGRQSLYLDPSELASLLARYGYASAARDVDALYADDGYAEPFFRLLGASSIEAIDASDYEGATRVHDLNNPIPEAWKKSFTLVYDGGCLEHIFNFPQCIRNCMELLEVGGTFLGKTPANNWLGHGFYQFSPELYFRVFSEANGFVTEKLFLTSGEVDAPWYEVADPAAVGDRVTLCCDFRIMMLIRARRTTEVPIFATFPQQSDYVPQWNSYGVPRRAAVPWRPTGLYGLVRSVLPWPLRRTLRTLSTNPFDKRYFRRVDEPSG